ncbi:MAG: type ISP restriction/modification enzyme [Oscillatoria sp. PMC 1068.18]|nr:type ISP restriction/modification enzyme [Oscillatoria sp. PMC 1076.18]MEC4990455.1 type ISP restriction/modification enzyme [Oscillatoria sp. PMC 1068.18]
MAKIYHADLYGSRQDKYDFLMSHDVTTIQWKEVKSKSPFYLFFPQDTDLLAEYNQGWKITEIMPINSVGIVTARDSLTIHWSAKEVEETVKDFMSLSEDKARSKYKLGKDARDWKVKLAQEDLESKGVEKNLVHSVFYRLFDRRYTYYTGKTRGFICMPRFEVMRNFVSRQNIGFYTCRQIVSESWQHIGVSAGLTDDCYLSNKSRERGYLLPLYIYPDTENEQQSLFTEPTTNFSQNFLNAIRDKLGYIPTPEQIFDYAYAIFHSPTYRQRYAEFLKIDFPHLPLTSNDNLFKDLVKKGEELVKLHLMESKRLNTLITKYSGEGDNQVMQVKYNPKQQRVYINKTRYFEGIPLEIWEFKIGGYQVLDKWLKDRKKAQRSLSFDEILHYQRVVVALTETRKIMREIDELIPSFPIS